VLLCTFVTPPERAVDLRGPSNRSYQRVPSVVRDGPEDAEGSLTIHTHHRPADERGKAALRRQRPAEERDRSAEERDRSAEERDRAAERRDRAGAERDSAAIERDSVAEKRASAAADRTTSHDRLAVQARDAAARDREASARDREASAGDRAHAGVDGLTGALRRGRGLVDLQREIERTRRSDARLVLAFVDVNGLKAVNDGEGHAAGDQLLREVALALTARLRPYDLLVRYGGDEFICTLSGSDVKSGRRRLDEVAKDLRQRIPTASFGAGLAVLADTDTLDELIARADAALYAERRDSRAQAAS
jgi:diguanylate cyclase (GGDEF)-like protein